MRHYASQSFWRAYDRLPKHVQISADRNFALLKKNPEHPSLHFKKINTYRSVRIGRSYRALAVEVKEGLLWFWIGTHAEYDQLVK